MLALALPHGASHEVFAQTECVQPLDSVAVEGTWNGNCLSRNREDAYARYYTFSVLRQSDVSITLESETDPHVFLLSDTGADADYLAENDDIDGGSRNFNSRVTITLEPGDYTIEATTYEQPAMGDFTLTVRGVGLLDDRSALAALYNATDGDNWFNNTNWLTDAPLDEWHGVIIDLDGRVSELNLNHNLLTGELPPELSNLINLKTLNLRVNRLTGGIPHQLGELTNLIGIDLSNNQLAGSIPVELGNLTNLTGLYLGQNLLAGDIPAELGRLTNLRVLYLDGNELTLSNEALSGISNLVNLEALGLASNRLSGEIPTELSNLNRLEQLRLSNNQLTGEIPLELIRLANMEWLQLGQNQLTGVIPSELGGLTDLEVLDLAENRLTGQIPDRLGDLTLLESLHLDGNQLTGGIPSTLSGLTALHELYLAGNRLTGCIPQALRNVRGNDFDELGLPFCDDPNLTPTLPNCVDQLPSDMRVAGTWHTDCTSDITAPQGSGDRYARFYTFTLSAESDVTITLNSDEDAFLYLRAGISSDGAALYENDDYNYPTLTDSRIEETLEAGTYTIEATTYTAGVTGDFTLTIKGIGPLDDRAALVALYNATGGDDWEDNDNWLTDALLDEWDGVTTDEDGRVIVLDLAGNDLTGSIPPELGDLSELEVLELNSNLLTGTLPSELGKLSELEHVELGGNLLTGTLPPELGKLSELEYLELSGNLLTGTLPPELGKLVKLTDFSVEANYLTGTIPPEIGGLASLEIMELSGNRFWGELPHSLTALSRLRNFEFDDNSGLCAPPSPDFQEWLSSVARARGDTCVQPVAPPDEREIAALTAIYNATGGDDWFNRTNWFSDEPVQFWSGISVNGEGHITELRLWGNGLSGQIPTELSHLMSLKGLYLSANQFTGTIPAELGLLTELERLYLGRNQLTGTIPSALGNLTGLQRLYLNGNQLTGSIPPELGKLTDLESLEINDNRLTGQLPYELTNLGVLDTLYFNGNDGLCVPGNAAFQDWLKSIAQVGGDTCVSGSEEADRAALIAFYNATDGDHWRESTNWLTAAPLSDWHGVSTNYEGRVVSLDLEYNSLSGAVPPEIGGLINLRYLSLGSNQLTGTLPPEMGNLTRLEVLTLNDNRLWGPLPDAMTALSVLHRFEFDYKSGLCAPPDTGFQEWLQTIPLLRSGPICVRTTSPPDDRDIAALATLYSATSGDNWQDSTNWLSEQPLQYWKGVHMDEEGRIAELRLGGNNLSGQIPPELGNLSKLERLSIEYNQLTGAIPSQLSNLTELTSLRLNGNRLTGAIPPELSSLNNLQILLLDNNELTGSIPSELGNLSELVVLWLDNNQLTGTIPPELGDPPNLGELFLTNNPLTGCLPFTLTDVPVNDFTQLDLPFCDNPDRAILVALYHATNGDNWTNNTNWLTDAPLYKWHGVDTDNRWNVHVLSLSDNQLTGQLPPELGDLHFVKGLYFDNNQLTGQIPPELGNLSKNLVSLWLHSNRLAGTIPAELANLDKLRALNVSDNQFTGELLQELTELRELYSLLFDNNAGLCAPTDADFQQWLQSIDIVEGPTCTDITPTPTPEDPIPSECVNSLGGTPAEGTWTADCLSINRTENGVHYARYYTFTLERRTTIELTLESRTDPYLVLLNEAGDIIKEDDDDNEGIFNLSTTDSGIRITLDSGNYIAEATTYEGSVTGDFTLTVTGIGLLDDRAALTALYNATDGPNWRDSTNWLTDAPLDEWYGVTTSINDRVTMLNLRFNDLSGEVPAALGDLSNLRGLYLGNNNLSGEIPSALGNLSNLKGLSLNSNSLSGEIPAVLGNLTDLEVLDLDFNNLSGGIPPELGNLEELVQLSLSRNELTGEMPSGLGELNRMRFLYLHDNQLTGRIPLEFGKLGDLEWLWLYENQLTGNIPSELGSLTKLDELALYGNQLTGGVPPTLGNLDSLRTLRLENNQLSGELPRELVNLRELSTLFFDGNAALCAPRDAIFQSWLQTKTYLRGDTCSAPPLAPPPSDPVDVAALTTLYSTTGGANWHNNTNWLTDEPLWEWYGVHTNSAGRVTAVHLGHNALTGAIPQELGSLTELESLDLRNNGLTGSIPAELGNLTELKRLILIESQLTGAIPPELGSLTNLVTLWLDENRLAGSIPSEMGNMTSLESLSIISNQLTGEIPSTFGNLANLEGLSLWDNQLTGEIPPELGHLGELERLGLSRNQLIGTIPSELGSLVDLHELVLSDNELTGEMPPELGNLDKLAALYVSDNQLIGELPGALTNLTGLHSLVFNGNASLCAPSDAEFQEWLRSIASVEGPICDDIQPSPDPTPTLPMCVEFLPDDMTVTGTWNTDCTSSISAPGGSGDRYARFYAFTLSAESDVTINLSSTADTYLYLRIGTSTDDSHIHENDDIDSANGDYNSRIEETLAPNTYAIEATTYAAGATGAFTLDVKIEGQPPTIDCTDYSEAPDLVTKVASGELPSVCDRMPSEPVVIPTLGDTGVYGGILRRFYLGPADSCSFFRLSRASLVRFSQDGFSLLPSVARDWEMSDDGKEWTFYLREGMKWSDGDDFNADDFVWQYENVLLNEELTLSLPFFLRIGDETGSIEKMDDTTVKFVFPQPNFLFLETVAQADEACYGSSSWKSVPWSPAHYMEQFHIDFNSDANTMAEDAGFKDWTGLFDNKGQASLNLEKPTLAPWKFTNPLGDQVVMSERNPYFWAVDEAGNQLPYLDGIQLTLVESIELGILSAVQSEIDMQARHIQLDQFPPLKEGEADGGYTLLTWPAFGGSDVAFFFNMSLPGSTGDAIRTKEFRQALSLAIDRELIQGVLFLGFGEIRQSVPPPGHPHYPGDDIAKLRTEYDPDAANALLDEVFPDKDNEGFRLDANGERIVMSITVTDTYGIWSDAAQVVGRAWEAVGVKTDVSQTTRTLHFTRWQTNEWAVMVWNEDTTGFTFNSIGKRAPDGIDSFHGPGCALWLQTGGPDDSPDAEGFPCAQESLDLLDMHRRGPGLPEAERNALGREIYKTIVENQYNIGIVGLSPMVHGVVIKKNTLHNVPDTAANDWILRTPNTAFPEQWYFKPATEP